LRLRGCGNFEEVILKSKIIFAVWENKFVIFANRTLVALGASVARLQLL
jgi:hypothetical protein